VLTFKVVQRDHHTTPTLNSMYVASDNKSMVVCITGFIQISFYIQHQSLAHCGSSCECSRIVK